MDWWNAAQKTNQPQKTLSVSVWLNARHFSSNPVRKEFGCFDDAHKAMQGKLDEHRQNGCSVENQDEEKHVYAVYKKATRHALYWLTHGDDAFDPDAATS